VHTDTAAQTDPDLQQGGNVSSEFGWLTRPLHPNALLIGPIDFVGALIPSLLPHLRSPIAQYDASFDPELPSTQGGTLVIWNVELLDGRQQRQLLKLIDDWHARLQIVSITRAELFESVQHGGFLETLYYRLNIVSVHASPLHHAATNVTAAVSA